MGERCPDHGDDESPWCCTCTAKKVQLLEVMIRSMAIVMVADVAELKGLNVPTDYATRNELAETVISAMRTQAREVIAANTKVRV